MKHSTTNTLVGAIASVVALAGIQQADAADALAICTSGQPYAYPNNGANIVFNPLGGFLHAGADHAEGFCYVNDIVVSIIMFLARVMRVADLDP